MLRHKDAAIYKSLKHQDDGECFDQSWNDSFKLDYNSDITWDYLYDFEPPSPSYQQHTPQLSWMTEKNYCMAWIRSNCFWTDDDDYDCEITNKNHIIHRKQSVTQIKRNKKCIKTDIRLMCTEYIRTNSDDTATTTTIEQIHQHRQHRQQTQVQLQTQAQNQIEYNSEMEEFHLHQEIEDYWFKFTMMNKIL